MKMDALFTYKDWIITAETSYTDTPYIIHNCDPKWYSDFTRAIVPQAPLVRMTYPEYVKQMECQFCHAHPPDDIITVWMLLNFDRLAE